MSYSWPGNVRELIHALEKAIVAAPSELRLYPQHLPVEVRANVARVAASGVSDQPSSQPGDASASHSLLPTLRQYRDKSIAEAEERYLRQLLSDTGADMREACRVAGLSRSRLYTLLKKYGITPDDG
jgi:DNA-binding NtrC family response regulator